jgi:hypothetical protein
MNVIGHHQLCPELPASLYPRRIGRVDHHDPGARAGRMRGVRRRNRVIARADCRHTCRKLFWRQTAYYRKRAARLEGTRVLQELQFRQDPGIATRKFLECAASQYWRADDSGTQSIPQCGDILN